MTTPTARREWPKEWDTISDIIEQHARYYIAHSGDGRIHMENPGEIAQAILKAIASPPASVQGKPTREALAKWFIDNYSSAEDAESLFFIMAPRRETVREAGERTADALLAAPIWPTQEPPATVDADDIEKRANMVINNHAFYNTKEACDVIRELLRRLKSQPSPAKAGMVTEEARDKIAHIEKLLFTVREGIECDNVLAFNACDAIERALTSIAGGVK